MKLRASLRRLQTDYIDLYQVHGWDSNTPLEETLRTLDDLVRQGKVRYIGLSNLMSWQAATAVMLQQHLGLEKYVTAQMYYSLVGRSLEVRVPVVCRVLQHRHPGLEPAGGRVSLRANTAAPTLRLRARASLKRAISCPLIRRWATAS